VVAGADELGAGDALQDLVGAPLEHGGDQRLGDQVELALRAVPAAHADRPLDQGVGRLGVDRQAGVGGQRPGRRGPGEEGDVARLVRGDHATGHQVAVHRGEGGVDAGVGHVLAVALRHLVRCQRRVRRRRVPGGLVVLDQQAPLPQLLHDPPARLDVAGVVGDVGVLQVEPEADALGHLVPVLDVLEHVVAAQGVEAGDAVVLDLLLVGEPEPALDRDLDRQAVRVPAALAVDAVTLHRLEAREQVLEHAADHVVHAGLAVRGGRALVEHPAAAGRGLLERQAEHVRVAPERHHLALQVGEAHVGRDGLEGGRGGVRIGHGGLLVSRSRCGSRGGCAARGRCAARARRGAPRVRVGAPREGAVPPDFGPPSRSGPLEPPHRRRPGGGPDA
jgi:hypothetical protein